MKKFDENLQREAPELGLIRNEIFFSLLIKVTMHR